jgi:threonine dehydrogenase-like Zn-dependent dehydrogenase
MRAAIWYGPREMKMADAPEPSPAPGEVLLKVEAVGICGSELSGYLGQNSLRKPPLIMGHEFSASVAGAADDVTGFAEGDRVTVNPMIPCNSCVMCRNGYENLCLNRSLIGAHRPGSFAEYVAVPAKTLYRLPEQVDSVAGTLIEPLACGLRAIELGHVTPGSSVLVSGAGPIGLLVLLAAKRAGASVIAISDLVEERLAVAKAWGATHVVNPTTTDIAALGRELTGGLGFDTVVDAVGLPITRQTAVQAVRPGGHVVFTGLHVDETSLPGNTIVRSEINIHGAFCYTQANFSSAVRLISDGIVPTDVDWLTLRPLDEADASFAQLIDEPSSVTKVILKP